MPKIQRLKAAISCHAFLLLLGLFVSITGLEAQERPVPQKITNKLPAAAEFELNLLPDAKQPIELEEQSKKWLQDLSSVLPVREGSAEEKALLQEVARLAAFYGFSSKQYTLDQIKTAHSFSSNLEIMIPADRERAKALLQESHSKAKAKASSQSLQSAQSSQAKLQQQLAEQRELVLLTPLAGAAAPDLSSLLTFMALCAEQAPPLPVRIVLLGSEHFDPEALSLEAPMQDAPIQAAAQSSLQVTTSALQSSDFLGSFSFLHYYKMQEPYLFVYLQHQNSSLTEAEAEARRARPGPSTLHNAWGFLQGQYREWFQLSAPEAQAQQDGEIPYQIIYRGSHKQSAIEALRLVSKALETAQKTVLLKNLAPAEGPASSQETSETSSQETSEANETSKASELVHYSKWRSPVLDLYLDFSAVGLQQNMGQDSEFVLAKALYKMSDLAMVQAPQSTTDAHQTQGRNYWLSDSFYISERQILFLLLLAIAVFAIASIFGPKESKSSRFFKGIVLLALSTVLALGSGAVSSLLQNLLEEFPAALSPLSQATISVARICLILILTYSLVAWSNIGSLSVASYASFAILGFYLWHDFSSSIWGLYAFFGVSLYGILYYSAPRCKNILLRSALKLAQRCIIPLLFVPYFVLPSSSTFGDMLLLLPSILLSFHWAQSYRRQYPKFYRYYLLRKIFFYIVVWLLSMTLFFFSQQLAIPYAQESFQLDEIYILPEGDGPDGLEEKAYKILRLRGAKPEEFVLRDYILGSTDFVVHSLEKAPLQWLYGQHQAEYQVERELRPEELDVLARLGASLLQGNSTAIRKRYSSIFRLQSPLQRLEIGIVAKPLELLYANFPFQIPKLESAERANKITGETASEQKYSELIIGPYPPAQLEIELLFAQKPEVGFLRYSIEFSPNSSDYAAAQSAALQLLTPSELLETKQNENQNAKQAEDQAEDQNAKQSALPILRHRIQVRNLVKDF